MPTVDVYADILFLINAVMDGLCLGATARLCHRRARLWRLLLAMTVGGVYAVLALLLPGGRWVSLGMDLGVGVLLCAIAFGKRRLPATAGLFLGLSMALGGVMTAVYNLLNQAGADSLLAGSSDGVSAWLFLLLALGATVVTLRGGRRCRRATTEAHCTVTVTLLGRTVSLYALVDSGHLLCDPLDGRPVICVGREAVRPLLSHALWTALSTPSPTNTPLDALPEAPRLRLLPASSVTGDGLLIALRPDSVTLTPAEDARPPHSAAREVDALIALIPSPTEDFQALVPAELWRN